MSTEIETMARDFFGYGSWAAQYWFIGPEPAGGDHSLRAAAFRKLEIDGLCDCKEFHDAIKVSWNHKPQKTWKRLILLLRSFMGEDWDILNYQRSRWGLRNGDTCVIELRGLNTKEDKAYQKVCDAEQTKRIERIHEKLNASQHKPKLVVMYGKSEARSWGQVADPLPILDRPVRHDATTFVFAHHPNARGQNGDYWLKDSYWEDLGTRAREASNEY